MAFATLRTEFYHGLMLSSGMICISAALHNSFHAFVSGNAGKCLRSPYKQQLVQRLSQGKRKIFEAVICFVKYIWPLRCSAVLELFLDCQLGPTFRVQSLTLRVYGPR